MKLIQQFIILEACPDQNFLCRFLSNLKSLDLRSLWNLSLREAAKLLKRSLEGLRSLEIVDTLCLYFLLGALKKELFSSFLVAVQLHCHMLFSSAEKWIIVVGQARSAEKHTGERKHTSISCYPTLQPSSSSTVHEISAQRSTCLFSTIPRHWS